MKSTVKQLNMILEDRERDIELAARIGQTLLTKNRQLQTRLELVDGNLAEVRTINERFVEENHQLKHQINLKDDLLRGFEDEQNRSQLACHSHIQELEDRNDKYESENGNLRRRNDEMEKKFSLYKRDVDFETENDIERLREDRNRYREDLCEKNRVIRALEEDNNQQFGRIIELERASRTRELHLIEQQKNAEASQMSLVILKDEIELMEHRLLQIKNESDDLRRQLKISKDESEQGDEVTLAMELANHGTPKSNNQKMMSSTRCDGSTEDDSGLVDEECFYSEILSEISTPTMLGDTIEEEFESIGQLPQPKIRTPKPQLSAKAK